MEMKICIFFNDFEIFTFYKKCLYQYLSENVLYINIS